jgi:hypothetical protein
MASASQNPFEEDPGDALNPFVDLPCEPIIGHYGEATPPRRPSPPPPASMAGASAAATHAHGQRRPLAAGPTAGPAFFPDEDTAYVPVPQSVSSTPFRIGLPAPHLPVCFGAGGVFYFMK